MAIKLIIFDFDGVLVDSEYLTSIVTTECLNKRGVDTKLEDTLKRFVGMHEDVKREHIAKDIGAENVDAFISETKLLTLQSYKKNLVPFKHVEPILKNLQIPFCVASNSRLISLEQKLKITKLNEFFNQQNIYVGSMVEKPKPAPDLYLLTAKMQNVKIEECLVIEDSVHGINAAVAAKMKVIGFYGASHCYHGYEKTLLDAGAQMVFKDLSEIPNIINTMADAY